MSPDQIYIADKLTTNYSYDDIKQDFLLPEEYMGVGLIATDNIQRVRKFHRLKSNIDHKKREVYPIAHLGRKYVTEKIKNIGYKIPIDYELFGRSFDGIDFRYIWQIKNKFPEDYKKIQQIFGNIEMAVKRYEYFR